MFKARMLFVLFSAALLVGCQLGNQVSITGSGNIVSQEETITGFDKVDASHSFKVNISQGEAFSVIVRIDDNILQHLEVVKQGSTLKIGLKPDRIYNTRNTTLEAEVTMPELIGLELSGASSASITGFKSTQALYADLSGSSNLRGDLEAGNVRFDLSGSSEVILTGLGQDVTIDASGSSTVDLADFPVADAMVDASGASTVTVNPGGRLDASASGSSDVYYLGSPTLGTIDTSGSSSVEPK